MDVHSICSFLTGHDMYLLTTHESPDGDGLGAEYALFKVLAGLGKNVIILNSDAHAGKYDYFDPEGVIVNVGQLEHLPDDLSDRHLVILDTDPTNIGSAGPEFIEKCLDVTVIDHHSPREDIEYSGWLSAETSSTCEMVFQILKELGIELSLDIATAL